MSASTPIARMVESMLAQGLEHATIINAIESVENAKRLPTRLKAGRGTRLSHDWQPSEPMIAYAVERGIHRDRIPVETEKFKNYWTAKSGVGASKRDWDATWRNWILNAVESRHATRHRYPASAAARPPASGANAILAGMGRLAHRLSENRNSTRSDDGEMASNADASRQPDSKRGGT